VLNPVKTRPQSVEDEFWILTALITGAMSMKPRQILQYR
jgi:hypothetical protein